MSKLFVLTNTCMLILFLSLTACESPDQAEAVETAEAKENIAIELVEFKESMETRLDNTTDRLEAIEMSIAGQEDSVSTAMKQHIELLEMEADHLVAAVSELNASTQESFENQREALEQRWSELQEKVADLQNKS